MKYFPTPFKIKKKKKKLYSQGQLKVFYQYFHLLQNIQAN